MALLAVFDEQEPGVSIPRCNRVLWIAALSTRFIESQSSLEICDEVETIFTHFLEELNIERNPFFVADSCGRLYLNLNVLCGNCTHL